LGSNNDQLRAIQKDFEKLEQKKTLYGVIETLNLSLSTGNRLTELSDSFHKMVLNREDEKVLDWLRLNDISVNHTQARKKHEPTTGNLVSDITRLCSVVERFKCVPLVARKARIRQDWLYMSSDYAMLHLPTNMRIFISISIENGTLSICYALL
jgi:hypothetical protein